MVSDTVIGIIFFQDSRVAADKKITDDKNPCQKSKWRP